jgi:ankyrin repeat protein
MNINLMRKPQVGNVAQQYKPSQRQPQRQPFLNRTIIPSKDIDPLLISTLLLKVSTDEVNLLDLGNFILSNGITTNDMLNEDGQSILHIILLNDNISSRKKLEIIKYLKSNFTLLLSYDKNGRTPLHLAVQNQLHDIVKELIEAGHDVNALDNFYKSPVHYAVIGKTTEAPQKVDRQMIPHKKTKIKSPLIKDLSDALIKYMEQNNFVKMFFDNQYNTIYNSQLLFNKDINKILNSSDVINKIISIMINPQLSEEQKQKQIFEKTLECNKNVKSLITTKLENVKKERKLESNIENGWGPNDLNVNKIMEFNSYVELNKILDEKIINKKEEINGISNTVNNDLVTYFTKINTSILTIKDLTNTLHFVLLFYRQLCNLEDRANPGTSLFNIPNLLLTDATFNEFIYDSVGKPNIYDINVYDPRLNFNTIYDFTTNTTNGINTYTNTNLAGPINPDYVSQIRHSRNMMVNNTKPENIQFKNSINALFNGGQSIPDAMGIQTPTVIIDQLLNTPPPPNTFYITKKLDILLNLIYKEEIDVTNQHILQMFTLIQNTPYNVDIINYLAELNIHIYNLCNIIPKIFLELNKIRNALINIKDKLYVGKLILVDIGGNNYDLSVYQRSCVDLIKKEIEYIDNNLSDLNVKMFSSIKMYHGILNLFIDYVNNLHSIKYVKLYYNQFLEPNLLNPLTDTINELFYLPIEKDNIFFKSYDELDKFIINKNEQNVERNNKLKFINKYLFQFNNRYINIYFDNTAVDSNGRNGFIEGNITTINNLDTNIVDINVNYNDAYQNIFNNITYDIADPNKIGTIQISAGGAPPHTFNKNNLAFPIISPIIDTFFVMQKYIITRSILSDIYDNIISTTPIRPSTDVIQNLTPHIKKLQTEIKEAINNDDTDISVLLITIAKIIDKIFNVNIDNIINITTNDFGFRYYRDSIKKDTLTKLAPYRIINTTEFNKINIDENHIDSLKKSIYKLFKKNRKLELFNYVENEFVKSLKDNNIFKVASSIIGDNPAEMYYKFNKDIIELLIKNGGDLNLKDKDGNTPLMIAMIQNNSELINYLLNVQKYQNISVFDKKSKNRLGIRPFDICLKSLKVILDSYYSEINEDMLKNITKEMNDKISKITKIKHNMRFNNILLKLVLYLLNHNFYSILNSYKSQTDGTFHEIFFKDITTEISELPLISYLSTIKVSFHKSIENLMDDDIKINQTNISKIADLEKQRTLLNDEFAVLNNIPVGDRNQYRIDEITDLITKINLEIKKLGPSTTYLKDEVKGIEKQKSQNIQVNITSRQRLLDDMKTITISNDILKIYDGIIAKIHNVNQDDYRTYTSLWEKLFETQTDIKTCDSTQVIHKSLNKLIDLIKTCKDTKEIKSFNINFINTIETAIDMCSSYINDYFDLPFVFEGDNYVLNRIIEILEHIIRNTLMVNLYHIIEKLIRLEVVNRIQRLATQSEVEFEQELDDKVRNIINSSINNVNIKMYLFEVLPNKLIKIVLNLYENDDDDDKKLNLLNVFDFIIKILEANTTVIINKDNSKIITTLETHVFPYFKEYIDTTIVSMKKFIDGYLSMILNLSSKLKIFRHIVNKAHLEK